MLKYALITNEKTKLCEVGVGTNSKYYESIGMTEQEVEQAYNGAWYLKGYAPQKPKELINQERIAELKQYLTETDYIANKLIEAVDDTELQDLKEKYADTLKKRREARAEINQLEK